MVLSWGLGYGFFHGVLVMVLSWGLGYGVVMRSWLWCCHGVLVRVLSRGLGYCVVMGLMDHLPKGAQYHVLFDNLFTRL